MNGRTKPRRGPSPIFCQPDRFAPIIPVERSRAGAYVASVDPVPTRSRRLSRICTRLLRRRLELRRHALDDDCRCEARRTRGQSRAFE
jgi:hypothetical protein